MFIIQIYPVSHKEVSDPDSGINVTYTYSMSVYVIIKHVLVTFKLYAEPEMLRLLSSLHSDLILTHMSGLSFNYLILIPDAD